MRGSLRATGSTGEYQAPEWFGLSGTASQDCGSAVRRPVDFGRFLIGSPQHELDPA
jgi:hypothetical protein